MNRTWWTAALLVGTVTIGFTVGSAAAQSLPPSVPRLPLTAQGQDGITVSARGSMSVPATRADVQASIASRTFAITKETLAPVEDALVQAGVDRASIVEPITLAAGPSNFVTITGTVEHPTRDMLVKGLQIMGRSFGTSPTLNLTNGYATLLRANCQSDVERARAQAIANARLRAQRVASQLGVKLGRLLAMSLIDESGMTESGECSAFMGLSANMPPLRDPGDYLNVRVYSEVALRFAIR